VTWASPEGEGGLTGARFVPGCHGGEADFLCALEGNKQMDPSSESKQTAVLDCCEGLKC